VQAMDSGTVSILIGFFFVIAMGTAGFIFLRIERREAEKQKHMPK
jgi:hypothetical protein